MFADVIVVLQLAIGLVFLWSTVGKLRDRRAFLRGLADYEILPDRFLNHVGHSVILLEAAVALSHLTGWNLDTMSLAAIVLLSSFMYAVAVALMRKKVVSCLCFSSAGEVASKRTVVRLGILLAAEMLLWSHLRYGSATLNETSGRDLVVALVCAAVALVLISWILVLPAILALLRKAS